jgi:hypothetical protein
MAILEKDPEKFDPRTKAILEYIKNVVDLDAFNGPSNIYSIFLNYRISNGSKLINLTNIQKYCRQLISSNDMIEIQKLREWISEVYKLEDELTKMENSGKISKKEIDEIVSLIGILDIKLIRELKIPAEFKEKIPGPLRA